MKNTKIIYSLAIVLLLFGCGKLVEIDPPRDQLVSTVVFENDETANSAMSGLYGAMMKGDIPMPYFISALTAAYGDELEYNQTLPGVISLYKFSLNPKDALTNSIWRNAFSYIFQANAIIEGVARSIGMSDAVKKQLTGEALFIRAFWNYYLTLLYGRIPLIVTTDYEVNAKLRRIEIDKIIVQIIGDLNSSKNLLSEKYVASNSITASNDRVRPNTFAASALLARVYLQDMNYEMAQEEATRVISNSIYELTDLNSVFKRTSREIIWQIELPQSSMQNVVNSYEGNMFVLTTKPSSFLPQRCFELSSRLMSTFNTIDKRKDTWIGKYTDNTVTPSKDYYFPYKYKSTGSPADEYTTPFRLAELFLIRAEAHAKLGNIDNSINDTDRIRSRAGLNLLKDIAPGIGRDELLDSITQEKRRELFCEWGIRWGDIRRSPAVNTIMTDIATQREIPWKPTALLWPIPLNDITNASTYIEQNEGYE